MINATTPLQVLQIEVEQLIYPTCRKNLLVVSAKKPQYTAKRREHFLGFQQKYFKPSCTMHKRARIYGLTPRRKPHPAASLVDRSAREVPCAPKPGDFAGVVHSDAAARGAAVTGPVSVVGPGQLAPWAHPLHLHTASAPFHRAPYHAAV